MVKSKPKLSVIIPVYNEDKTIASVIAKVLDQKETSELVVVDDASKDGTKQILEKLAKTHGKRLKIHFHSRNQGKGAAILTGLAQVTGTHVIIQDADLEYDPSDYAIMMHPVIDGKAEVVFGSRFFGPHRNMLFWHKLANDILNLSINFLFDTTISDCETGYKLLPTSLLRQLKIQSKRFDFEIEVTCKLLRMGVRIYEVPISYAGREYSEGKKIKFRDAIIAFLRVLQYRFL